jgi:hypothetical protein
MSDKPLYNDEPATGESGACGYPSTGGAVTDKPPC